MVRISFPGQCIVHSSPGVFLGFEWGGGAVANLHMPSPTHAVLQCSKLLFVFCAGYYCLAVCVCVCMCVCVGGGGGGGSGSIMALQGVNC